VRERRWGRVNRSVGKLTITHGKKDKKKKGEEKTQPQPSFLFFSKKRKRGGGAHASARGAGLRAQTRNDYEKKNNCGGGGWEEANLGQKE